MSEDGDITPLGMSAAGMHELYTSMVDAGFDAGQALYLLGVMLTAGVQAAISQPEAKQ